MEPCMANAAATPGLRKGPTTNKQPQNISRRLLTDRVDRATPEPSTDHSEANKFFNELPPTGASR